MSMLKTTLSLLSFVVLVTFVGQAQALPTKMVHIDTPGCDPLFIPENVDEIGEVGIFPDDEDLFATNQGTSNIIPCPTSDIAGFADVVVEIRNLSGRDWLEVWYVANPETTITNYDGEANDIAFAPLQEAFRIDNDILDPGGINHALIFESIAADGIWESGESWRFVLQDYTNSLGLPPSAINSLGVGNASGPNAVGAITSSGSIIGVTEIPEPSTCLLMVFGLAATAMLRKSGC